MSADVIEFKPYKLGPTDTRLADLEKRRAVLGAQLLTIADELGRLDVLEEDLLQRTRRRDRR